MPCHHFLSFSFNITAFIYTVMCRSARNQCPQDCFKIAAERSPAVYAFTVQMRKCKYTEVKKFFQVNIGLS